MEFSDMGKAEGINYELLFEQAIDALFVTDSTTGIIAEVNRAGCNLLGYTKDELLNRNLPEILGTNLVSDKQDNSEPDKLSGILFPTIEITTKSGNVIPVEIQVNTVKDDSSSYHVTSLRNASERVSYEKEILSMNEELTKISQNKDIFFSIIGHDLKNPMNTLISLSQFLKEGIPQISRSEIVESSRRINSLSKNTYQLLENLLDWTRLQSKQIEAKKEKLDLFSIIEEVTTVLKPSAALKQISIVNYVFEGSEITADKNMLKTILRNLISNGIKFSPKEKSVQIMAEEENDLWKISIIDEGIGMDEEQINHLFDTETENTNLGTSGELGTGLGLAICNQLVKAHNGKLSVVSQVNQGSEFIVELPKAGN